MDYFVKTGNVEIFIESNSKQMTDEIVDRLVAYRKSLKMTQQDIADATGIKRANVTRIEAKRNEASLDSLVRIAASMGLKLNITLEKIEEKHASESEVMD